MREWCNAVTILKLFISSYSTFPLIPISAFIKEHHIVIFIHLYLQINAVEHPQKQVNFCYHLLLVRAALNSCSITLP